MNAPNVFKDHPIQEACRKAVREKYGIRGPSDTGNEYMMVNVVFDTAGIEGNGSSLQNFANAECITTCVENLLEAGVLAD